MDVLGLMQQQARVLLIHYRWNVEALLSAYGDDAEACFKRAGLVSSSEGASCQASAGEQAARPPTATTFSQPRCEQPKLPLAHSDVAPRPAHQAHAELLASISPLSHQVAR